MPSPPEPASRSTVHLSPTQLHARAASQTETAAARINELLTGRRKTEEVVAVRVGIKSRGCNGLSYTMNYASDEPRRGEEAVEQHGAALPRGVERRRLPVHLPARSSAHCCET